MKVDRIMCAEMPAKLHIIPLTMTLHIGLLSTEIPFRKAVEY